MVVGIVSLFAAMVVFLPRGDRREADVRAAAEELAATLRSARAKAMDERGVYAVVFNLRNGLGTSGRVLNNQDGGHWYRLIGSNESQSSFRTVASYPLPSFYTVTPANPSLPENWPAGLLAAIRYAWIGDRHVLPPRRVRFLALADQDNGGLTDPTASQKYVATYPRPWFGWYDPAAQRLYPWGGYDPALKDAKGNVCSGFYYQGTDANGGAGIVGSANPSDRTTTWDSAGTRIFTAGKGRPLVNGNWLDYCIRFNPDGTVEEGAQMALRFSSYGSKGASNQAAGGANTGGTGTYGDFGDLSGRQGITGGWQTGWEWPMTNYWRHTGRLAITLCPDAASDTDRFASAQEAVASLWPAYRVMVNRLGLVEVVKVKPALPAGATFDSTIASSDWNGSGAKLANYYKYHYATNADGTLRAKPVSDALTTALLTSRNWWLANP